MAELRFDDAHPFFDEAVQFTVLTASTFAVGLHAECDRTIGMLGDGINELHSQLDAGNTKARLSFNEPLQVPDYPHQIIWREPGFTDECILKLNDGLGKYLVGNGPKPRELEIVFQQIPPSDHAGVDSLYPPTPAGYEAIDRPIHTSLFETAFCYLVGGAFERHHDNLKAKYAAVSLWPVPLQFFRHLRNGCFHSNRFDIRQFKGKDQIDPCKPPKWHTFVMPSDAAMNGKKTLGENGFISATHILPLLYDMGPYVV